MTTNSALTDRPAERIPREIWILVIAAYLVFLRISAPDGRWVDPGVAQGWVRALVGSDYVECVHELPRESTPTYVWVVDGSFLPIASPAELVTPAPVPAR